MKADLKLIFSTDHKQLQIITCESYRTHFLSKAVDIIKAALTGENTKPGKKFVLVKTHSKIRLLKMLLDTCGWAPMLCKLVDHLVVIGVPNPDHA